VAYFVVFSLATLAAFGYRLVGNLLTLVVAAMFLTTLWLLYLQAFVIHHFCQFCLLSALVTTTLTAEQLAAIVAVKVPLSVVQGAGNGHNGSATWTYSVAEYTRI